MRSNRGRDTGPEIALRRALHARGLRYRVDHPLPFDRRRRADVLSIRTMVAVFVDGCFWHGCPEHGSTPRSNSAFWSAKIERNRARDAETTQRLEALGWSVLRFWEHEDPGSPADVVTWTVARRLRAGAGTRGGGLHEVDWRSGNCLARSRGRLLRVPYTSKQSLPES